MKKNVLLAMSLAVVMGLAACGQTDTAEETSTEETVEEAVETEEDEAEAEAEVEADAEDAQADVKGEGVMTYEEYAAADLDSEVVVETYVQATQSWWDDTITVYSADQDGAYFIYNMACTEDDAAKLVPGTKIKVTGYKSEWSGEVEITDATFEFEEGEYIAEAEDVTDIYGTDALADEMNKLVTVKGLTVEASTDADGNEAAFLYNWDGSGEAGSNADLYFNASLDGVTYTFTVESYLTGEGTDVYTAVEGLNIGDTIDIEGFLYWYESAQPHVTAITVE